MFWKRSSDICDGSLVKSFVSSVKTDETAKPDRRLGLYGKAGIISARGARASSSVCRSAHYRIGMKKPGPE